MKEHEIKEIDPNDIPEEAYDYLADLVDDHTPDLAAGSGLSDVLKYLPIALEFIQGLLSGQAEIPAFHARVLGHRKKIGPCPVVNDD